METIYTDRRIVETGCMLYMRIIGNDEGVTVFAFKHDEFRCDFQIFQSDCYKGDLESWLLLPISTAASY
jgi:hypothetical protein